MNHLENQRPVIDIRGLSLALTFFATVAAAGGAAASGTCAGASYRTPT